MIEKIAKLLAKAERASTPEEAEAYFAAAQRLSTTYSIDLAKARQSARAAGKRETPIRRTLVMEDFGRNTKKHLVRLYQVIAWSNDVMIDIAHDSRTVYPYGFPSDLDVVDAMFAVLAPQMVRGANDFINSGAYKAEIAYHKAYFTNDGQHKWIPVRVDGRVARSEFYLGFAQRIRARLQEARKEAIAEVEQTAEGVGTELVLADKSREVRDYHKARSNAKGTWGGPSQSKQSALSQGAGRDAGDQANLNVARGLKHTKAVEG